MSRGRRPTQRLALVRAEEVEGDHTASTLPSVGRGLLAMASDSADTYCWSVVEAVLLGGEAIRMLEMKTVSLLRLRTKIEEQ